MVALKVVVLCVFIAVINALPLTVSPPPNQVNYVVGTWSPYIFVTCPSQPTDYFTVTVSDANGAATVEPSTLEFSPSVQALSYRYMHLSTSTPMIINYNISGNPGSITAPPNVAVVASLRPTAVEGLSNLLVDRPSDPVQLSIVHPSASDLTFTMTTNQPSVTFTPNPVTIPAGSLSTSFYLNSNAVFTPQTVQVLYMIDGAEAAYYSNATQGGTIRSSARGIYVTPPPASTLLGASSGTMYAYMTDAVNQTVTLIPQAADTVFNGTLQFTPDGPTAIPFNFVTTSPSNSKSIFFTIAESQPPTNQTEYAPPNTVPIYVPFKTVTITAPTLYFQNKHYQIAVSISAPVVSDLTVSLFCGGNVYFNQSTVTFGGPNTTQLVDVWGVIQGPDTIFVELSGTDKDYYTTPAATSVQVAFGSFLGPWYLPQLTLGVESDKIPIRVNVPPTTNVTLTLVAADLTFNPSTLVFTSDKLELSFTVTPTFTSVDVSTTLYNSQIGYVIGGGDAAIYTAPAATTITVSRRTIQAVFPPQVNSSAGVLQLNLLKSYNVWVTASYVDHPVTITPSSPYITFSPPSFDFTSSSLQVAFKATVNHAPAGTSSITWLISGQSGGWYTTLAPTTVSTSVRPLFVGGAVVAPDTRIPQGMGVLLTNPSTAALKSNHIYSFTLVSAVIPDSGLTITPRSQHVTFSPASISFGSSTTVTGFKSISSGDQFIVPLLNVIANFSVTPKSNGVHEVWFELSGDDADGYARPPHVYLSFLTDQIPAAPSTSSHLVASVSMLLVAVVLSLLM